MSLLLTTSKKSFKKKFIRKSSFFKHIKTALLSNIWPWFVGQPKFSALFPFIIFLIAKKELNFAPFFTFYQLSNQVDQFLWPPHCSSTLFFNSVPYFSKLMNSSDHSVPYFSKLMNSSALSVSYFSILMYSSAFSVTYFSILIDSSTLSVPFFSKLMDSSTLSVHFFSILMDSLANEKWRWNH